MRSSSSWIFDCNQELGCRISGHARGTQREYSSKTLKHSIVKRILVFKR